MTAHDGLCTLADYGDTLKVSENMGVIAGILILAAIALWVLKKLGLFGKKK